jgi:hypothetical protein
MEQRELGEGIGTYMGCYLCLGVRSPLRMDCSLVEREAPRIPRITWMGELSL